MISREVLVSNRAGLHARAAVMVVQLANKYPCAILFQRQEGTINAKSIMGILTLAAVKGTTLTLTAEGDRADEALQALADLFDRKFDEGE
ncbi:MAG TPA: HPr family phosphocarrier protein [bacterium]|nr:HPr family phosphocarrier protein [bacterium]